MDLFKRVSFFLFVWLFLPACSQALPEDTLLSLVFHVGQNINPDDKQRPSPLVISLFELKAADAFQQSDFYSLYEHSSEQLSTDLISKRRLRELVPGIDRTDQFILNKDTKYVGVLAEFVHFQQAKARLIVPIKQKADNSFIIELSGTDLKRIMPAVEPKAAELQPVRM